MPNAIILSGSNLGDSMAHLHFALESISNLGTILKTSSFYKSSPYGNPDQSEFLNHVIEIQTNLKPEELLQHTQYIEQLLGRTRTIHWGPRTLDLDILYYDNHIFSSPSLTIPHPDLHNRRFTLMPLCEILPNFMHPTIQQSHQQLLNNCQDQGNVTYFAECNMP
jgi:2-amino-4-hydroxy-6-hydroxymethyldihydropteridine diphosphokinase